MNKKLVIALVIVAILVVGLIVYQIATSGDILPEGRDDRIENSPSLESDDQVFNEFDSAVDGLG